MMGGFTDLSYDEGGAQSAPPIFICENHRKSNKIMHCVEKKFFRVRVLKIGPFFMVFNLVLMGGGALCAHYRSIDSKSLISGAQQ